MERRKKYIAYGSNLNLGQMARRCPTARVIGKGEIKDHELLFRGGSLSAVATVEPKAGSSVPVLIWEIEPEDERNLDIYEKWLARGRRMNARDCYYYAREWMDWGDAGMAERAFARFLAMPDGWIENRVDAYIQRAECLQRLGRRAEARQSLLASLALGAPRAEALCALGDLEMEESLSLIHISEPTRP